MVVRLRSVQKLSVSDYRLTLDLADNDRQAWDFGDCALRIDLHDGPDKHLSSPRGLLRPAFEPFSLSPSDPPTSTEARLLWDIGKAARLGGRECRPSRKAPANRSTGGRRVRFLWRVLPLSRPRGTGYSRPAKSVGHSEGVDDSRAPLVRGTVCGPAASGLVILILGRAYYRQFLRAR